MKEQNIPDNSFPLVSVVMNCHNCADFLRRAIDSVREQTYSGWQIIFYDNCSTDLSKNIALSYLDSRIKYFYSSVLLNLGEARNCALREVDTKYVAFLDCDDIYYPEKLEQQISFLEESAYPMVYAGAEIINENDKRLRINMPKNKSGMIFGRLLRNYEINMQSVMLKTSIIHNNELGFSHNLGYSPDYNLFMKIAARYEIGVMHHVLVKYRTYRASLSRKKLASVGKEILYTHDEIIRDSPVLGFIYKDDFAFSIKKTLYYDSIYLISVGDYSGAARLLSQIRFIHLKFLILLFFVRIKLPRRLILHLLRR